jgi:hypothetical protein
LGCHATDPGVDFITMLDDRGDQFPGQRDGRRVAFGFGEMPLQDRFRRALSEVGLEDRGERESTSRPSSALPVSLRPHRR